MLCKFLCLLLLASSAFSSRRVKQRKTQETKKKTRPKKTVKEISHRSSAQCKNHAGEDVDWWFILEESGKSKRYLYFDSQMAQVSDMTGKAPRFMPLDKRYRLDDPNTSPLLKTLYMSRPYGKLVERDDNTIITAVNDQRGAEGAQNDDVNQMEKQLRRIAEQSRDPNADLIRVDKGKDIFGHPITARNAHSKYVYTSQVVFDKKKSKNVKVRSYLISHSLPRFPNFTTKSDGTMALPHIQSNVFSKNAQGALAKGQHFFCKSFEDEETLDSDDELEYEKKNLDEYLKKGRSIVSIFHLFKTINAAVVFSNYYNRMGESGMKVYRKLLDPRKKWSEERDLTDLVKADIRLYPLGPVKPALRRTNCTKWSVEGPCDKGCVTSYSLSTTNRQFGLDFNVVAHNGIAKMDLFDDIVAPQVLPKQFYKMKRNKAFAPKYFIDALIVQSWMDHSTLSNNMRELVTKLDNKAVQSKVWIANSLSLRFPIHKGSRVDGVAYMRQQSFGSNHSKIAFSVPLHGVGKREPLFCFADKNRTLTQRGRSDEKRGRGGAAWCTRSGILSALMLSLHPDVVNNVAGSGIPVSKILPFLPDSNESERIAVLEYDKEKTRFNIGIPSRSQKSALYVCSYRHPFVNVTESEPPYRPREELFALDEVPSDVSSSESSSSEADSEGDSSSESSDEPSEELIKKEEPRKNLKRKSSQNFPPVKVSRPRYLGDFGSPMKAATSAQDGTPQKFKAAAIAHAPNLLSPEHYRLPASKTIGSVDLSSAAISLLSGTQTPETFPEAYKQVMEEDPRVKDRPARKVLVL